MRERRGVEFQFKVLIMEGKEWTEVGEGGGGNGVEDQKGWTLKGEGERERIKEGLWWWGEV